MRFLVKIAPDPLPNRNHLRIVCNSSQPDCFAHYASTVPVKEFDKNTFSVFAGAWSQKSGIPNSDFPMNSRKTSPVGAMKAPACASRKRHTMLKCFDNATQRHTRIEI